jgi:hypothetical protein
VSISLIISQIGSAGPECTTDCSDPTIEAHLDRDIESSNVERDQTHNNSDLTKRDEGIVRQQTALPEMIFFNIDAAHSLTDPQTWTAYDYSFYWDASAGNGVPVYIVDTGANLQSIGDTVSIVECITNVR